MKIFHPEMQSQQLPREFGVVGSLPLEPKAQFNIRCNKRVGDMVREFCDLHGVEQRSFWEEAATRLVFAERQRDAKNALRKTEILVGQRS
jgi:hypothetical protein